MIDVAYYFFNAFGMSAQPGRLMLPKWVNVREERFNKILNTINEAKNNELRINVNGREITLDNAESLLKDIGSGKIDKHEFKKNCNTISNDVKKVLNRSILTRNQIKMIKILSSLREIVEGSLYEKPDIKIMPEESEGSDSRNV